MDGVAIAKLGPPVHRLSPDARAVLASEILQEHARAADDDARVTTGDSGEIKPDGCIGGATDGVLPLVQRNSPLTSQDPVP